MVLERKRGATSPGSLCIKTITAEAKGKDDDFDVCKIRIQSNFPGDFDTTFARHVQISNDQVR